MADPLSIQSMFGDMLGPMSNEAGRLAADRALGEQLQQGSAATLFAPERARRLRTNIGNVTGADTRTTTERQADQAKALYSSIDFNDPASIQRGAEALRKAGFPDAANKVLAEGKRIARTDAQDARAAAQEQRATTRFGYEVSDREQAEAIDDVTASVPMPEDGDMVEYYRQLGAALAKAGFGEQARGAFEEMRVAATAKQGGERYVPVGKNIFDREKGIFISGPNEGSKGVEVEEVGEDGRIYKYFQDPTTGEVIGEKRLQPLPKSDATTTKQYKANSDGIKDINANTLSYNEILDDLAATPFSGGSGATIEAALKDKAGLRNKVSAIKTATSAAALREALGFLPPGPATDKDMEQALKTVPPDNASSAEWTEWLTKVMRLANVSKEYYKAYNKHIADNNSIIGFEPDAAWAAAKQAAGYQAPSEAKKSEQPALAPNALKYLPQGG